MELSKMVEEINLAVNGTIMITHYVDWELSSYKDQSLFYCSNRIQASSFKEVIEKGYEKVKTSQAKKK